MSKLEQKCLAQTEAVNGAFEELSGALKRYLATCAKNQSPIFSISVSTYENGSHMRTKIRYRKNKA